MPAYNLEDKILDAITATEAVLQEITEDYEIIIVDDGSTDRTWQRVSSVSGSKVRSVKNSANRGKGYAVKKGVELATGEYMVMSDADMEVNYHELRGQLSLLRDNDLVIASKRHPNATYDAPRSRKFLSLAFNALVRLLIGVRQSDTQTGLKAFRGPTLKVIMNSVLVKRYAFDVEILAVARLLKLRIAEVPANVVQGRGFSARAVGYMLIDLLGIAYRLRILKWYQQNLTNLNPSYDPLLPL